MILGTFLVKSLLDCAIVCSMLSKCDVFLYHTVRCSLLDTPSPGKYPVSGGGRCFQLVPGIPYPGFKRHEFASCANRDLHAAATRRTTVHYQETKSLKQCKFGGTYFQGTCHVFVFKSEDLKTAMESCMGITMTLLTDSTEKKSKFLAGFLKGKSRNHIWTAGVYGGDGIWIWRKEDNVKTRQEIIEYKNWSPGHPPDIDSASEYGIAYNMTTFSWEAINASQKFEYVCETRWTKRKFTAESQNGNYSLKGDCEYGGISFNGSCYLYVHSGTTWESARSYCDDKEMNLLEITSEGEMGFVVFYMKFIWAKYIKCHWIGLNDRENATQWVWGGSNTLVNYTNWENRQPDGNTFLNPVREACVAMYINDQKTWHDFPCDQKCDFVCEFAFLR